MQNDREKRAGTICALFAIESRSDARMPSVTEGGGVIQGDAVRTRGRSGCQMDFVPKVATGSGCLLACNVRINQQITSFLR